LLYICELVHTMCLFCVCYANIGTAVLNIYHQLTSSMESPVFGIML